MAKIPRMVCPSTQTIPLTQTKTIKKQQQLKRNTTISICKALAIILMVIGHADCPGGLSAFLYEFHMPLFFMAAGYFFSLRYLNDEATFIKKRIRGLYLPFLKWSVFFLCIHNLMFDIGLLNEQYGNWSGGVTHPYTWHQAEQRFWNMISAMGGYDEFLCGAFWFFRGLLVASILYLVLFKIGVRLWTAITKEKPTEKAYRQWIPIGVCLTALLLAAWKTSENLKVITLVQGGYRDIMGIFFFGMGFLFRQWEHKYKPTWWNTVLFFVVVLVFSIYLTANMNWRSTFNQFLSLPVPALCGCLLTYNIATWFNRHEGRWKQLLVYMGDHTLAIFVFHIISFKIVSAVKILYYDMDWAQIGCHMVIHDHASDDLFWLLYGLVGVSVPLLVNYAYEKTMPILRSKLVKH